jgi:hypothetical protein
VSSHQPIRVALLAAALAALLSVPLEAQDSRLARLDPAVRNGLTPILDSARLEQLPTEPLIDKALEGTAKGAPTDRIVLVVRALRVRLLEARAALGAGAAQGELMAGATALAAGIPSASIRDLRQRRPGSTIILPLTLLSDLISRGVSVETAQRSLRQVLESDPRDDDRLRSFVERVRSDIAQGMVPDRSALDRARSVSGEVGTPPTKP